MAEGSYQVIFSGQIIEGAELEMVKRNVAHIFTLDPERVEKLFCGRRLILKKQIDRLTAEKYQSTMQRAGAVCVSEDTAQARPASSAAGHPRTGETTPVSQQGENEQRQAEATVSLAEAGTVLAEQQAIPEANINTTGMDMAEAGILLVEPRLIPEANIDTAGMDMAEAGIQLVESRAVPEANIDTTGMDMAEAGITLAEHVAVPAAEFDTSTMSLDAPGVKLVESKDVPAANIDTSHLSAE